MKYDTIYIKSDHEQDNIYVTIPLKVLRIYWITAAWANVLYREPGVHIDVSTIKYISFDGITDLIFKHREVLRQ